MQNTQRIYSTLSKLSIQRCFKTKATVYKLYKHIFIRIFYQGKIISPYRTITIDFNGGPMENEFGRVGKVLSVT